MLNALYQRYRDRAAFYVVYIREAHPVDGWQLDANLEEDVLIATPKTAEDRDLIAGTCMTRLGIELPALVDAPDNRVDRAYTAWPDRLYLVDRRGIIEYKGGPGPFGFKPQELETSLERVLALRD